MIKATSQKEEPLSISLIPSGSWFTNRLGSVFVRYIGGATIKNRAVVAIKMSNGPPTMYTEGSLTGPFYLFETPEIELKRK